jgi:predicted DNA-binding transcriptional regulator AlpA
MQNSTQDFPSPLLTERQAARYLTRSVSSLRRDRKSGTGPGFVRFGRSIRYLKSQLDDFISAGKSDASEGVPNG